MESLGQKLKETREQHNFSLEQVARDTHISKHYLEALEQEDFAAIPGETYTIGFLRNYAEYLSLNPEEVVTLYKNTQIQEQPLPMTELLEPGSGRAFPKTVVLVVALLAVLGGGGYLLYRYVIAAPRSDRPRPEAAQVSSEQPSTSEQFEFEDEAMTRWFNQEDTIGFPLNGNTYSLQLLEVGRTLTMKVPGGTLDMTVGQDRQLDVNGDGRNDLRILLNDLDTTDVARRANLSLYKITRAPTSDGPIGPEAEAEQLSGEGEGALTVVGEGNLPQTGAEGTDAAVPIITADSPAPFRVSVSFRGYCLFRYVVDRDIREERFFHKGESFSLDARDEVRLWISNAGVVRLMVAGRELEIGRPGAVTSKRVRWRQDQQSGKYILEVVTTE